MENRSRIPNFSKSEVILLEELVSRNSRILEKGVSNAAGWEEKKNAWKKLAIQFNLQNSFFRSAETLRKKWDNRKMRQKLQRENNTQTGGAASKPNYNQLNEECTTGLLNTLVTGPESMFDCDGDSKDDTYMIEAPILTELDPLSSGKEDSKTKHSEVVNNNCHDYSPRMKRRPIELALVTENIRKIKIPVTIKAKWRFLADIKIKLTAARLRHEREEHILKMECLKVKRREEEKEHLLRAEEIRFRRRCLEVHHQEGHQEHLRRMEKIKRED